MDTEFDLGSNREATPPGFCVFSLEQLADALYKCLSTRSSQPDEDKPAMGTRFKLPDIGEIQFLCNQEPFFPLCCPPYFSVSTTIQVLHLYGIGVMAKCRQ